MEHANLTIIQAIDAQIKAVGGSEFSDEAAALWVKAASLMNDLTLVLEELNELKESSVEVSFVGHDYLEGMHDVTTCNDYPEGPFFSVDKLESEEDYAAYDKFNKEALILLEQKNQMEADEDPAAYDKFKQEALKLLETK